ncbi:hypothetical protein [Haematobacter sp.]|uniref:hypothetical protein n=1 Tax=Haematobacter sp. TaxID=2953762 RepID=UPI0028A93E69|nr:hypothetical protein [Haematobacter sp.]
MDATTQAYIDRSMDAVRAQNDARFAEVLSRIDSLSSGLEARFSNLDARFAKLDARFSKLDTHMTLLEHATSSALAEATKAKQAAEDASAKAGVMKWNILFTALGVAALLAAVFAAWVQAVEMVSSLLNP